MQRMRKHNELKQCEDREQAERNGLIMIYYGHSNSRVVPMSEMKNIHIHRLKSSDTDQAFIS